MRVRASVTARTAPALRRANPDWPPHPYRIGPQSPVLNASCFYMESRFRTPRVDRDSSSENPQVTDLRVFLVLAIPRFDSPYRSTSGESRPNLAPNRTRETQKMASNAPRKGTRHVRSTEKTSRPHCGREVILTDNLYLLPRTQAYPTATPESPSEWARTGSARNEPHRPRPCRYRARRRPCARPRP